MFAENLALHVEKCLTLPTHYIWGGIGELITKEVIFEKATLYSEVYTEEYRERLVPYLDKGIRGYDCSGLINQFRMGGLDNYKYQEMLDWNSQTLFEYAQQKGGIGSLPELRGICLYMKGHVGIYVGGQRVIEATSNPLFGNGIVETNVVDRPWTHWFCCPGIKY